MNKDLSDKEIEDFSNLTNKVLKEICRISDAHNIDRDSTLKYFADSLRLLQKLRLYRIMTASRPTPIGFGT